MSVLVCDIKEGNQFCYKMFGELNEQSLLRQAISS